MEINLYGFVKVNVLDTPKILGLLPPQKVTAVQEFNSSSSNIIDYYEYRPSNNFNDVIKYKPEDIIHFKAPGLLNPYVDGKFVSFNWLYCKCTCTIILAMLISFVNFMFIHFSEIPKSIKESIPTGCGWAASPKELDT